MPLDNDPILTFEQQRAHVKAWKARGEVFAEIRREQARNSDTIRDMTAMGLFYTMAIRDREPSSESGLVEFHRRLRKAKRQTDTHHD